MDKSNGIIQVRRAYMTQEKAAEIIGLCPTSYCHREKDPNKFQLGELKSLYKALDAEGQRGLLIGVHNTITG